MSRRPSSIALLLLVLATAAGAIWLITTRSRPVLAVYDSMPAAPAPLVTDARVAGTPEADTIPADRRAARAADSAARHLGSTPRPPRARVPAAPDSVARPHRSDNYGGYSGYGSKERRGDPNAR